MRGHWAFRKVKMLVWVVAAVAVLGAVVMGLWNWLMPTVFGLKEIGYWQALALLVLGRILFGGFHRHWGGMHWRHRMMQRWASMTPEEREKFRAGMHGHCCHGKEPEKPAA